MPGTQAPSAPRSAACHDVLLIADAAGAARAAAALTQGTVRLTTSRTLEDALADGVDPAVTILVTHGSTRELAGRIQTLRAAFPETAVILVLPAIERWELRAALTAGASGVLLDDDELERSLPGCLAAVLTGHVCVPREHGGQLTPRALSTREKQILGLVVMGYMNCQIAQQLFLAESTVKSHLSSAFVKLGVRSRNEATSLILDPAHGLGMGILSLGAERITTGLQTR